MCLNKGNEAVEDNVHLLGACPATRMARAVALELVCKALRQGQCSSFDLAMWANGSLECTAQLLMGLIPKGIYKTMDNKKMADWADRYARAALIATHTIYRDQAKLT